MTGVPGGALRGVVFLGGLREVGDDRAATAINRDAFEVARSVAERFEAAAPGSGFFVTVQDTGGCFGLSGFAPEPFWTVAEARFS